MTENKTCCFIGHRKIQNKEAVYRQVTQTVLELILKEGVKTFHFGSKSEFDDICHIAVTRLQGEYPDIIRINYNKRSEYVVKKEEKEELEEIWRKVLKKDTVLKDFEGSKMSEAVFNAGKWSYVKRNQEMIEDSEYCIFFYLEDYAPAGKGGNAVGKSGTRPAYEYAVRKKKKIINIAQLI